MTSIGNRGQEEEKASTINPTMDREGTEILRAKLSTQGDPLVVSDLSVTCWRSSRKPGQAEKGTRLSCTQESRNHNSKANSKFVQLPCASPVWLSPIIFLLPLSLTGQMTFIFPESFNKRHFSHNHLDLISSQTQPPPSSQIKIRAQVILTGCQRHGPVRWISCCWNPRTKNLLNGLKRTRRVAERQSQLSC